MFTINFDYFDGRGWVEIAKVSGCEAAYEAYTSACKLAELIGADCALIDTTTDEICAMFTDIPEESEDEDDYEDDYSECGYNPYMGCYDYDC